MTVAEALPDVDHLRREIRQALRCVPRSMTSTLAAAPTPRSGSEKARRALRPIKTSRRITARGTATRPHQSSAPLYDGTVGRIAAIWRLRPDYIASLLARYAPTEQVRVQHANRLAVTTARRYRSAKVRDRARVMAFVLLQGGDADDVRQVLEISTEQWRDSNGRRTFYEVRDALVELDCDALLEWSRQAQI